MSSQNPPNVPIFNGINYNSSFFNSTTGNYLTYDSASGLFLQYPTAQGSETFNNNVNFNGNVLIGSAGSLTFGNSTTQTSSYTGLTPTTTTSYTSANLTVDTNGKITAISNGSGGGGGASLTANQTFSGINGFSNTIQGTNATSPISYTSTIVPSSINNSSHITSKGYTDATYAQINAVNTFGGSGTNTFNTPINISGSNSLVVGGYCGLSTGVIVGTNAGGQYLTVQAPVFAGNSGTGYIDPLLYGNDITTSTSIVDNSITSRKYNDARYLMLSNGSGQTISTPITTTTFINAQNGITSLLTTQIGNNGGSDKLYIRAPIYTDSLFATKPMSYALDVSTYSTLTDNMIMNKKYIDNVIGSSSNLSIASLTTSGSITCGTNLQINGNIYGSTNTTPLSYPSTISTTMTNYQIPNKLYIDNNYASLSNNQTLSGVNGFSNTIQGTNGTSPISYSSGITSSTITSPQHLTSKAYVDNAISVSGGASLSANQTFTGTNTFSNTVTAQSALVAGISSAPTAISLYCLGVTQFSSTIFGYNGSSVTPVVYSSTVSNASITSNQHIVMKGYTDATYANLSGATFTGTLNSNNGLTVNSNIIVSSTGTIWGKSYREKTAPATINTAGTVYTIDWSTSSVNTLNTAPTANFTLNLWNITLSTVQTNVMTLKYLNTGKFYPTTINIYSDSGSTAITTTKYWLGGTPTIASAYISTLTLSIWQSGVLDGTSNNICELTLGNSY